MRIALGLEYDGRGFCGWQSQSAGCAVQDALERALASIAGEPIRTIAAGRTDTGVHAALQVVHFDTSIVRPPGAWTRGVNALLPAGMAVLWQSAVDEDFHARFSAIGRRYRYVLLNRAARPGLLSGRVGWDHRPLDLDSLRIAASDLVGEHDFSAFRSSECQASSPVRTLRELCIEREGDFIVLEFAANAFLHHMIRNIVGALVYVGSGRQPVHWLRELLQGRDRRAAAPTFSPDGLYLTGVEYPARWQLPSLPRTMGSPFFGGTP